jgi:hypothetical protein
VTEIGERDKAIVAQTDKYSCGVAVPEERRKIYLIQFVRATRPNTTPDAERGLQHFC